MQDKREGNCSFGNIFSLQSSDFSSSGGNGGDTFLQPEKGMVAARW